MRTDKRASGVIIKDGKVLVFHRFKYGRWYRTFPGGGVEDEETTDEAMVREIKEELCLDVKDYEPLFMVETEPYFDKFFNLEKDLPNDLKKYCRYQHFFLVTKFEGTPELGGPEKERASETNQFNIEWIPLTEIEKTTDLYPEEARKRLVELIKASSLT